MTKALTERHDARRAIVNVSTPVYVLAWWMVLVVHLVTAAIAVCFAVVHLVLSLPSVYANTAALLMSVTLERVAGLSYLVVALLHIVAVSRMAIASVGYRGTRFSLARHASVLSRSRRSTSIGARPTRVPSLQALCDYVRNAFLVVFGTNGYFGVNGPGFATALLVRELVEILMQTYQLWSLSYSVSRVWINRFAVAAVVLNSVSIPLVSILFRQRGPAHHLMDLVVDMHLDFVCTVIVPVCLMQPYAAAFDWTKGEFPAHLVIDDVWFANALADSHQVLVTSALDYCASLLPQYSIYVCLRLVKQLLRRRPLRSRRIATVGDSPTKQAPGDVRVGPTASSLTKRKQFFFRTVSSCIVACGIAVAYLHLSTERMASARDYPGCQLYVRPWFATKVPCSVLYINCYRRGITGFRSEMSEILQEMEPSVLTKVVFMHCPALSVPPAIVRSMNLGAIEIVNATLVDWPVDASVRQATHPRMTNIIFTATNVTTVPPALLHRELPLSLLAVGFTNCTIAKLPEDLGDLWVTSRLGRLGLDGTRVQALPPSLGSMGFHRLFIDRSPIESFPPGVFRRCKTLSIRLSGMPLRELPESVGDTTRLTELLVEHTNVSTLPLWAVSWLDKHHADDTVTRSFFGSPVCETLDAALIKKWQICERDWDSQYGYVEYGPIIERYPL